MAKKHILVVGAGSIGKRHAKNLVKLGCEVSLVDPRSDRLHELDNEVHILWRYPSMAHVGEVDGVVIATPPAFHLEQCLIANEWGTSILCEKGLTLEYDEAQIIGEKIKVPFLMGYTWRWWPTLNELFDVHVKKIAPLRRVEMRMCAHLHDWHPGEPLKDFYIATRGGIGNENHWIDVMLHRFGFPYTYNLIEEKISDLDITENDFMNITAGYNKYSDYDYGDGGFFVDITLDLIQRPHQRTITLIGENGTIWWTPNQTISSNDEGDQFRSGRMSTHFENISTSNFDRNHMFMEMMKHWLKVIDGEKPLCTLQDGIDVVEFIHNGRGQ